MVCILNFSVEGLLKTLRLYVEPFSALDSLSEDTNFVPPLSTSCSPVTKLNFGRFRIFWPDFGAMYQENMKRKGVS